MAKKSFAPPKPIYRDGGYTGIHVFTLLAMVVSIGLLFLEFSEDYDSNSDGTGVPPAQTVKSLVGAERKAAPAPAPVGPAPLEP